MGEPGQHHSATPSAIRLWRHLFGDRPDLIELFTAYRDDKDRLQMPSARHYTVATLDDAWAWARQQDSINREVYFCAHQLLVPERRKDNAAAVLALWCDLDAGDLALSPITPTAVVESSPDHYHCYARLSRAVRPDEAEVLNHRWALAFGADPSGWDLTQLLRVPGTRNHKYESTPDVRLLDIFGPKGIAP
jgi:hypothetical protein